MSFIHKFASVFIRRRRILIILASIYPCLLLLLSLIHLVFPQHNGTLAITEVFAPYLFFPVLILLPLLLLRRAYLLRGLLVACVLLFCVRFFPHIPTASATEPKRETTVLSWNMLVGHSQDAALLQLLKAKHPAIVALQEVDKRDTFATSPEFLKLYPYQLTRPATDVPANMALLSIYPIVEHGTLQEDDDTWAEPEAQVLWARLDLGSNRSLVVISGHPVSPINAVPGCYYCSDRRDGQLRSLNAFAHTFIQRGETVLLVGDMNVTDREPGYYDLTTGLQDSFEHVGLGSGHSWGFRRLNPFWPMLRLDYMLAGPRVTPLALDIDCAARGSDHCALMGHFAIA